MSVEESTQSNQIPDTGYDRDAIIASIRRYYQLLSKMVAIKPKHIAYSQKEDSMTKPFLLKECVA